MHILKKQLIQIIDRKFYLISLTFIGCVLLLIRVKWTYSFFLTFLIWNLILGWVPLGIAVLTKKLHSLSILKLSLLTSIWLLFLPNAPYIITDFIHLQLSPKYFIWYDAILIFIFALAGLYCYIASFKEMCVLWQPHLSKRGLQVIHFCIPFVTAFGIYLGRFLRFNSWDVMTAPQHLIQKIGALVFNPADYKLAWLFIITFGFCLWFLSFIKKENNTCIPSEG